MLKNHVLYVLVFYSSDVESLFFLSYMYSVEHESSMYSGDMLAGRCMYRDEPGYIDCRLKIHSLRGKRILGSSIDARSRTNVVVSRGFLHFFHSRLHKNPKINTELRCVPQLWNQRLNCIFHGKRGRLMGGIVTGTYN